MATTEQNIGEKFLLKPLYLLADSQLFFSRDSSNEIPQKIRADLSSSDPKAAYLGASNGDRREFYQIFVAAMEVIGIRNCRMVPAQLADTDRTFLEEAALILLAGGEVEQGWQVFQQNGMSELLARKRYDGTILVGVSAGAVQLGLGALSNAPQPKQIAMLRFAPFYVGAHDEENEWWDLRALVNLAQPGVRGIGIPAGGGAIYWPDGTLEPVRRPLAELSKEGDKVCERILIPPTQAST